MPGTMLKPTPSDNTEAQRLRQRGAQLESIVCILHDHLWRRLGPEHPGYRDAADVLTDLHGDPDLATLLRSVLAAESTR
jgi:hypothetical protein